MAVFPVSAVTRNPNQIDVFTNVATAGGGVYSAAWDGTWRGWFLTGDGWFPQHTPVAAVSRYPDHLDLFAVAGDGAVWSAWWHANEGWSDWFRIGGGFAQTTPVAAISRNPDHLDLFAVGGDGAVWSVWWHANEGWSDWFRIGGGFAQTTPVAAISRNPDHLDLFAVAGDGAVWSVWWHANEGWSDWYSLDLIGKNFTFDSRITRQQIDTLLERHAFAYSRILTCGSLRHAERQALRQAYRRVIGHGINTDPDNNASAQVGGSHIDVNFNNLFPLGMLEIAQTLIHEMMHCAGYSHPERNRPPVGVPCAPPFDCPYDNGPYYSTPPLQAELCIAGIQSDMTRLVRKADDESCVIDETGRASIRRHAKPGAAPDRGGE